MNVKSILTGIVIAGCIIAPSIATETAIGKTHLERAHYHLQEARKEIEAAARDKTGFFGDRVLAERDIDASIGEVTKSITYANEHRGANGNSAAAPVK